MKKITINGKREPIYRNIKAECCPTCKEPLDITDALNDGTDCKCGVWWFNLPLPFKTTGGDIDQGWHFKASGSAPERKQST